MIKHIAHWPTGSGAGGNNGLCGAQAPIGRRLPAEIFDIHNGGIVVYAVANKRAEVTCEACLAHLPRRDGCLGGSVVLSDGVAPFGKRRPTICPRHRRRLRYTGWSIGGRHHYACPGRRT